MPKLLQLELDRTAKAPLAEQIRNGIGDAIETGVLASGARGRRRQRAPPEAGARPRSGVPGPAQGTCRFPRQAVTKLGGRPVEPKQIAAYRWEIGVEETDGSGLAQWRSISNVSVQR
jgi:hypothetical protein